MASGAKNFESWEHISCLISPVVSNGNLSDPCGVEIRFSAIIEYAIEHKPSTFQDNSGKSDDKASGKDKEG